MSPKTTYLFDTLFVSTHRSLEQRFSPSISRTLSSSKSGSGSTSTLLLLYVIREIRNYRIRYFTPTEQLDDTRKRLYYVHSENCYSPCLIRAGSTIDVYRLVLFRYLDNTFVILGDRKKRRSDGRTVERTSTEEGEAGWASVSTRNIESVTKS